jgi:hypothetical protein
MDAFVKTLKHGMVQEEKDKFDAGEAAIACMQADPSGQRGYLDYSMLNNARKEHDKAAMEMLENSMEIGAIVNVRLFPKKRGGKKGRWTKKQVTTRFLSFFSFSTLIFFLHQLIEDGCNIKDIEIISLNDTSLVVKKKPLAEEARGFDALTMGQYRRMFAERGIAFPELPATTTAAEEAQGSSTVELVEEATTSELSTEEAPGSSTVAEATTSELSTTATTTEEAPGSSTVEVSGNSTDTNEMERTDTNDVVVVELFDNLTID